MKKLKTLLKDRSILWFLEYYPTVESIQKRLEEQYYTDDFKKSVLRIAHVRAEHSEELQKLMVNHMRQKVSKCVKETSKVLIQVQKLLGNIPFIYKGKEITAYELAVNLFKPLGTTKKAKREFTIGEIHISFDFVLNNIDPSKKGWTDVNCGFRVTMVHKKGADEICFCKSASAYISRNWWNILPIDQQRELMLFDHAFDFIGKNYLMTPWYGSTISEPRTTLFGYVAQLATKKTQKMMPQPFSTKWEILEELAKNGKMATLKSLLKMEYRRQSKKILPELMICLFHKGGNYIAKCRHVCHTKNPHKTIFQKLDTVLSGVTVLKVPGEFGVHGQKVFVLCVHENTLETATRFQTYLQVSGYSGSWIIASQNFPTICDLLITQQIDYVCQTSLGSDGWKDLYKHEIMRGTDMHELWKDKVIKLSLTKDSIHSDVRLLDYETIKNKQCEKITPVSIG